MPFLQCLHPSLGGQAKNSAILAVLYILDARGHNSTKARRLVALAENAASRRKSARASFRRRTFLIEHRRSRRAREPAMQRPRRTRSRGWGHGAHSEISSKFSLACVMSAALSTALEGLAEAAPAPVVVERAAFERATARRRGREAIHGRGSVALLVTLGA